MYRDSITDEIRSIRHQLAERFDNDVDRIGDDLRRREADSLWRIARLPRRLPSVSPRRAERDSGSAIAMAAEEADRPAGIRPTS